MQAQLYRRNGRPQACDACRARKVSCGNERPKCRRCQKRAQNCVYTISDSQTVPSRPSPASRRVYSRATSRRSTHSADNPSLGGIRPVHTEPGYLGFVSHCTVFEETRTSLSLVHGGGVHMTPTKQPRSQRPPPTLQEVTVSLKEKALGVLRHLPGPDEEIGLIPTTSCVPDVWMTVAIPKILQTLRQNYASYLDPDCSNEKLEEMAQELCNNSSQPMDDACIDGMAWLGQFTGPRLRWESLGLLAVFMERTDDIKRRLIGYSVDLAHFFTLGNVLLTYLCYRRCTLISMIEGDASLPCWIAHAESVALVTFLGLHVVESDENSYVPTLCSEIKRRLFWMIYTNDKTLAAFTGRPPLLTKRYTSVPLPLELSDRDLFADEATRQLAMSKLDDRRDYNLEILAITRLRGRLLMALVTEDIVEMTFLPNSYDTTKKLQELKRRQDELSIPSILQYQSDDLEHCDQDMTVLFSRIQLRLNHLQNLFILERLLRRNAHPDDGSLLTLSFELVSLALVLWKQMDKFYDFRRTFEWLAMGYAAPGAGVLSLELLRPTFSGTHPTYPEISRSAIIQQLSLFTGFLDWIQPPAPNADLCADCSSVIKAVLDHVLNNDGGAFNILDWPLNPMSVNFDLLDSFDWLRTEVDAPKA